MDWAVYKKIKIKPKTMILSLLVISLIEAGMRILVFEGVQNTMMLLGGVRFLEIISLVFLVMVTEKGFSTIGLEKGKIYQGIRRGIFWSGCFGIMAASVLVLFQSTGISLLEMVRISIPSNLNDILLLFLVGGLIGPVAEELFFRGIVYGFLRSWGMFPAILLSTFFFVLAHPELPAVPVVQITGGLLFAIAYEVEGTLMAPLSIHILGNMAIYVLSILFY